MPLCNVNIATGDVYHTATDLFLRRGFIPFGFTRDYDSGRRRDSAVGQRWRHNQDRRLLLREERAIYVAPDGPETDVPHPDYLPPQGAKPGLRTRRDGDAVLLSDPQGTVYRFEPIRSGGTDLLITAHVDSRGNRLEYRYDPDGILQTVKDTLDRIVYFARDDGGHITGISVSYPGQDRGRQDFAQFEYDLAGDLRTTRGPNGAINQFVYHKHQLVEHVNPLGGRTFYEYDAKGRCIHTYREGGCVERTINRDDARRSVEIRDSRGATWFHTFNAKDRPLLSVDPLGRRRVNVYDQDGNLESTSDEAASPGVTLFFEDRGLLISQNGSLTSMVQYDEKMRVTEEVNALGAKTSYEYDDHSNRIAITDERDFTWQFEYDPDGWLRMAKDPRGFRFWRTRKSRLEVENRDDIGLSNLLRFTPLGQTAAVVDALGNATEIEYDAVGNPTAIRYPDGGQAGFEYDATGNLTRVISESGAITTFEYDKFGAAVAVRDPLGHRGTYRYDTEENLVEVRNFKGETATLQYDLMDNLVAVTLFDGRSQHYTRGPRGVVAVRDEKQNLLLAIERDDSGRIAKKIFPGDWEVSFEWGDQCQLLSVKNPHATVRIDWTPNLKVAAEHVGDFSVTYEYDEVRNRKQLVTSQGREIAYKWDARNRLKLIEDAGRATYRFSYDEVDVFREWVGPTVVQRFAFDVMRRMTRRTAVRLRTEEVIADREFQYDVQGRLVAMRDRRRGAFHYRYSNIDAIVEVRGDYGVEPEWYAYDANENLTKMRDGADISYGLGNRIQRAGSRTFEHDSDGAVTRIEDGPRAWVLEYNPEGRLDLVRTPEGRRIEYHYDPLGRRIRKIVDGQVTRYFWDRFSLLREESSSGGNIDYLFIPETFLPVGMTDRSGHYSFIPDQAGTPTEVVGPDGDLAWSGDYSAFGEVRGEPVARVRNPFRFQGQYFDEETGFHYNVFRYYYPPCARYLSQDPLGLNTGANLYRYVLNPFNWLDPLGLSLAGGVLTMYPICGWSDEQKKEAQKKVRAMNKRLNEKGGITLPSTPHARCGKTAKEIYEDCQKKVNKPGKPPVLRDLNEGGGKCLNEQADHILEVCTSDEEEVCANLQPLNESVNKSFGSQVGAAVRTNPGAALTKIELAPASQCTERPSVDC